MQERDDALLKEPRTRKRREGGSSPDRGGIKREGGKGKNAFFVSYDSRGFRQKGPAAGGRKGKLCVGCLLVLWRGGIMNCFCIALPGSAGPAWRRWLRKKGGGRGCGS